MKILSITFLIILSSCVSNPNSAEKCVNPLIDSAAIVQCIAVIDGDTWKMKLSNDIFPVRVLNIDCFEIRNNAKLQEQAAKNGIDTFTALQLGLRAKETAEAMLLNSNVIIIRDYKEANFDIYNRLLRHCYIDGINYADYIKSKGLDVNE